MAGEMEQVTITSEGQLVAGAQLLFRPLPLRLGTMAYLVMGPYIAPGTDETTLWSAIHQTARRHKAAFLKWEPGIHATHMSNFTGSGFRPSPQTIQPPRTTMIDIGTDDDTIMERMNQGTRRKIRQSMKKGVRYYQGEHADLAKFNTMMQTTGSRNAFGVHAPGYYDLAYDFFVPEYATLIMAEHEGNVLAGIMVFAVGKTAWYLYGASSNIKRNLMGTYGVQWEAIQWAKARGCQQYDLWGIPDENKETLEAQFQERSDGLWGVYGFKRGWGGEVVRSVGTWDYVYNPMIYSAYKMALKWRS